MKCPNCHTNNPDSADWCSLCLTRFDASTDEPAAPEAVAAPASVPAKPQSTVWEDFSPGASEATVEPEVPREGSEEPEVKAGPIRKKGAVVEWVCPRCERTNAIESRTCELCGTSIYEAFDSGQQAERPAATRNAGLAAMLSVIPGAGHFYAGRAADGVLRLTLALWWAGIAYLMRSSPWPLLAVKVTHFLAVIGLAGLSAADAYRAASSFQPSVLLTKKVVVFSSLFSIAILLASLAFGMMIET